MQVLSLQTLTNLIEVGKQFYDVCLCQINPQKMFVGSLNLALSHRRSCCPTGNAYHFTLSIALHCKFCISTCIALILMN